MKLPLTIFFCFRRNTDQKVDQPKASSRVVSEVRSLSKQEAKGNNSKKTNFVFLRMEYFHFEFHVTERRSKDVLGPLVKDRAHRIEDNN